MCVTVCSNANAGKWIVSCNLFQSAANSNFLFIRLLLLRSMENNNKNYNKKKRKKKKKKLNKVYWMIQQ